MEGWPWVVLPQGSVQRGVGMFLRGIESPCASSPAAAGGYCAMTEPRIMFMPQVNGVVPAAGVRGTSTG